MSRLIDADELKTAFPCGEHVRTESVRATIDHAPTVTQWIPCSERQPTEDGEYITTVEDGEGMFVTTTDWRQDWKEWGFLSFSCGIFVGSFGTILILAALIK